MATTDHMLNEYLGSSKKEEEQVEEPSWNPKNGA